MTTKVVANDYFLTLKDDIIFMLAREKIMTNLKNNIDHYFATSNINKTITTAITNYNSAYINYIVANSTYCFSRATINLAYFLGENLLSDLLSKLI